MPSLDVKIANQSYILNSDESDEHLREVTDLVKKKIESLLKKDPNLAIHKATMLVAFDLASQAIKGRKKAIDYKTQVLKKTQSILESVQNELSG